jgi:hypothetical protein
MVPSFTPREVGRKGLAGSVVESDLNSLVGELALTLIEMLTSTPLESARGLHGPSTQF